MNPDDLSPRMQQVVVLVGGLRLSYKATGKRLRISARTVEAYARQVRDRTYTELAPQDACTRFYWEHRTALDDAA